MTILLYIIVISLLLGIAIIDARTYEIPNKLNLALCACGVLLCCVDASVSPLSRGVGLVIISIPLLLIALLFPESIGMGDVKLMGASGLILGWEHILLAACIGICLGGIQAVILLVAGKKGRKDHLAFGPALCIGIAIALFAGTALQNSYTALFMM